MPTKCWCGSSAWKRSYVERDATGVFAAARQQLLAGIYRLIAREHLHGRSELRNLAYADATLRGDERKDFVLQSGDRRENL